MAAELITDLHPFNDPEQVEKNLLEFKATEWEGFTLGEIVKDYIHRFRTLPVYPVKVKAGTILFRARRNSDENQKPFIDIKQLGLKPRDKVTTFGRANLPGHSVFYCSDSEETVVKEVTQWYVNDEGRFQDLFTKKVLDGNWNGWTSMMTISAWLVKEELTLGLLFGNEINRSEHIQNCGKKRYCLMPGETEKINKSRNLILDFYSSQFLQLTVKHESEYLYSALYSFDVMNNLPHLESRGLSFDGVTYPSIANNFRGENFALNETVFSKNKIVFLGANFCYTCNNHKPIMDVDSTVLIGRVSSAIADQEGKISWVNSTEDFDYLAHYSGKHYPFTFPSEIKNRFCKAVTRIKA